MHASQGKQDLLERVLLENIEGHGFIQTLIFPAGLVSSIIVNCPGHMMSGFSLNGGETLPTMIKKHPSTVKPDDSLIRPARLSGAKSMRNKRSSSDDESTSSQGSIPLMVLRMCMERGVHGWLAKEH